MRLFLSLFLLSFLAAKEEVSIENKNFFLLEGKDLSDTNRLRFKLLSHDEKSDFSFTFIADNLNYYSKEKNQNEFSLYRLYLSYEGDTARFIGGLQRVPFGVGRIWNPIDFFNPIDAYALDQTYRKGSEALRFDLFLSELSTFNAVFSEYKQAFKWKSFLLERYDVAIVYVNDEESKRRMIGWEFSSEVLDGAEIRSEGGLFSQEEQKSYTDCIIGFEKGFASSLTFLSEYRYESLTKEEKLAFKTSYTFSPLLEGSYLLIKGFHEKHLYSATSFLYSLSDESTAGIGILRYHQNSYKIPTTLFISTEINF